MHLPLSRLPRTFAFCAGLTLLSCLPTAAPDRDDGTSAPTLSHPGGSDTSASVPHHSAIVGEALVTPEALQGTESLEIRDGDGLLLCRWTWDTDSVTHGQALPTAEDCALPDGSPCQFAHAVVLTGGREEGTDTGTETDCAPFRSLYPMQPDGGLKGYGYGSSGKGGYLLVFADNPAPEPDLWIPLLGAGTYAGEVLEYRLDWKQETVR